MHALSAVLLICLATPGVQAQGAAKPFSNELNAAQSVLVRATRPSLPDHLVTYLAEHAAPRKLQKVTYPNARAVSAARIFRTLCGRTSTSYVDAFKHLNGLPETFDLDAALGDQAYQLQWPACLYISETPADLIVEPKSDLSTLFFKATGRAGGRDEWKRFFGRSDIDDVAPGEALSGGYSTMAMLIKPLGDVNEFRAKITDFAKSWDGVSSTAARVDTLPGTIGDDGVGGEIVVAKSEKDDLQQPYVRPLDCPTASAAPFNLARIKQALALLGQRQRDNAINVSVLDNGFMGASSDNGALSFTPPFPGRLFDHRTQAGGAETIGPLLDISANQTLDPLIKPTKGGATFVSGHGTHVVGAVLGGDAAGVQSGLFDLGNDDSWLRLTIVPLSAGERMVSKIALNEAITQLDLSRTRIANFSVRYGSEVEDKLRDVIKRNPDMLFVVAAGNDARDVIARVAGQTNVFPARLGGETNANVITVAAEDGLGNLTRFTNRSSDLVDIAAPGCNISSWIDGTTKLALSGTSQAAPLVTFTASMLAHYKLDAASIKRRILLSGNILSGQREIGVDGVARTLPLADGDSNPIYSRSRLDVTKALYLAHDYVRFEMEEVDTPGKPARIIEALGILHLQGDLDCKGLLDSTMLLALKRGPANGLFCFANGTRRPAMVGGTPEIEISFTIDRVLTDTLPAAGTPLVAWQTIAIPIGKLREFIRSDKTMTDIEKGK